MEINGKKVVVIGGASGMGRASAELLHERGADVAVLDREGSDGKDVAEGIGGTFYPVDVTDYAGTTRVIDEVHSCTSAIALSNHLCRSGNTLAGATDHMADHGLLGVGE